MNLCVRYITLTGLVAFLCLLAPSREGVLVGATAWAQPCPTNTVSIDTSMANSKVVVWSGRAWGQVFLAPDTLIQSITVWRYSIPEVNEFPMKLYISEIDSTERPITDQLLLDGPSVVLTLEGDGVTPERVDYVFDPPFALPRTGKFFFAIKDELCFGAFGLLSDTTNPYPHGKAWITEPLNLFCDDLGCCPWDFGGNIDLIFDIVFCLPPTTDVSFPSDSWGRIKANYR